eukprot:365208-Chlamydomonas_euryale.AAC.7
MVNKELSHSVAQVLTNIMCGAGSNHFYHASGLSRLTHPEKLVGSREGGKQYADASLYSNNDFGIELRDYLRRAKSSSTANGCISDAVAAEQTDKEARSSRWDVALVDTSNVFMSRANRVLRKLAYAMDVAVVEGRPEPYDIPRGQAIKKFPKEVWDDWYCVVNQVLDELLALSGTVVLVRDGMASKHWLKNCMSDEALASIMKNNVPDMFEAVMGFAPPPLSMPPKRGHYYEDISKKSKANMHTATCNEGGPEELDPFIFKA